MHLAQLMKRARTQDDRTQDDCTQKDATSRTQDDGAATCTQDDGAATCTQDDGAATCTQDDGAATCTRYEVALTVDVAPRIMEVPLTLDDDEKDVHKPDDKKDEIRPCFVRIVTPEQSNGMATTYFLFQISNIWEGTRSILAIEREWLSTISDFSRKVISCDNLEALSIRPIPPGCEDVSFAMLLGLLAAVDGDPFFLPTFQYGHVQFPHGVVTDIGALSSSFDPKLRWSSSIASIPKIESFSKREFFDLRAAAGYLDIDHVALQRCYIDTMARVLDFKGLSMSVAQSVLFCLPRHGFEDIVHSLSAFSLVDYLCMYPKMDPGGIPWHKISYAILNEISILLGMYRQYFKTIESVSSFSMLLSLAIRNGILSGFIKLNK